MASARLRVSSMMASSGCDKGKGWFFGGRRLFALEFVDDFEQFGGAQVVLAVQRGQLVQAVARFGNAAEAEQDDAFGLQRQQVEAEQAERGGGGRAELGFVDLPPVGGNAEVARGNAFGVIGDDEHVVEAVLVEIVAVQAD